MKALLLSLLALPHVLAAGSPKRGLIYIPNANTPQDDPIWVQPGAELTWYYTYNDRPNPLYDSLEFVPMMWGMGGDPNDKSFYNSVVKLMESGRVISHALAFNEPDLGNQYGGSNLDPARAAAGYVANFVPLQRLGVRVGMPAVAYDLNWLRNFVGNCTQLLQGQSCPHDFLPLHWYDNFGSLEWHVGEAIKLFPDTPIWVTEYAYAHQSLQASQEYYQQSANFFDNNPKIERYSYFGAFRSKVSNIGPNPTFLNNGGRLTDIGSWYLGGEATGVLPDSD